MRADFIGEAISNSWRKAFTESGIQGWPIGRLSGPGCCVQTTAVFHAESSKVFSVQPCGACVADFHVASLANEAVVPSAYSTTSVAIMGGASAFTAPAGLVT